MFPPLSPDSDPDDLAPILPFRLDDRVALVTGAGRGIGAATARALADAGAEVVLVSRTRAELEAVAARIERRGGRARVHVCDVTDSAAIRAAIGGLDRLDVVVNNAGTNIPEPFVDVSDAHLDTVLDLNVRAYFVVAQAAVRKMLADPQRAARGGVVINVSSQMGHIGSPNRTAYCMTKHAVEGLTKAMAVELAPQRIRVNSVAPTFVDTALVRSIVDTQEKYDFLVSKIPLGHMAEVRDIAAAVVYLCSPAAAMVTGTSLLVDGGWTAQ
ncbi:NAD(P)-dependent dehydrogenase (short-subunit alcohol dehydrogenase family) [Paraburkholderia caballeronis]|uniref:SDR family NAD(P)-dependent oxidoreductase n=1 Tax=Paraburkholderia caballeronis TaxID=416943 RepID=UPI001066A50A|nr:glucose 1-dehydrogenase [Paraburkholderia caballeronis]TDV35608.1 NAD(P)-dependent dehydrogenase (short-subunit alcohol dehydrogenase family) [Paraburkholderia caballeronis]